MVERMESKRTLDLVAVGVSITALFLSVGSLVFSIHVFQYEHIERLLVTTSLVSGRDEVRCQSFGGHIGILQVPAKLMLSNNGDKTLSVVAYEVYDLGSGDRRAWYSYIDGGLTDAHGAPVSLPLTLEPGESRHVEVWLGLQPDHAAQVILDQANLCKRPFSRRELMQALGRESIDLYGNRVSLQEFPDGQFIFKGPGQPRKEQVMSVIVRTGRGSVFEAKTSWYPSVDLFERAF